MSWLDDILDSTKELESPRSFFFWSALCAVSAVVKDHVWLNRGRAYNLYPNIYVILHGGSGLGKGLPIAFSKQLVQMVGNTRVISGRSSIEGILQELSTATTTPQGMIADSAGYIVASEFSSSLIKNPMAITILTDLYDRIYNEGEWKNLLKTGPEKLKKPTITLLGGVNEAQFRDALTQRDMQGGFLGRSYLIRETKRNVLNPLMDDLEKPLEAQLYVEHLRELAKLKGAFTISDEAKEFYKKWYFDYYGDEEDLEDTGTYSRMRDTVLKVSMLLSLSIDSSLMITRPLLDSAIKIAEPLAPSAAKATMGKGKSSFAEQTALLIQTLLVATNNSISRENILKRHWKEFDSIDLDRMIITLTENRAVVVSQEEGKVYYTLTPEAVEAIEQSKMRRKK